MSYFSLQLRTWELVHLYETAANLRAINNHGLLSESLEYGKLFVTRSTTGLEIVTM